MNTATNLALNNCRYTLSEVEQTKKLAYAPERVVLVDDDPVYRSLFSAVGQSLGVSVKTYKSLAEMVSFAHLNQYEFAFVDYHLESFKGTEIAEYVDIFFPHLPVFLISADEEVETKYSFPNSIKKFYCKTSDPYMILHDAVEKVEQMQYYEGLRTR